MFTQTLSLSDFCLDSEMTRPRSKCLCFGVCEAQQPITSSIILSEREVFFYLSDDDDDDDDFKQTYDVNNSREG